MAVTEDLWALGGYKHKSATCYYAVLSHCTISNLWVLGADGQNSWELFNVDVLLKEHAIG